MKRPGGGAVVGALLVVVLAVASRAWTLGLDFQIDDFVLIPDSGTKLRALAASLAPGGDAPDLGRALEDPDLPIFQPVLWAMLAAERALSPEPLSPRLFHAVSLALHALTALALFALLRRWVPLAAAAAGAGWFALHPAGGQAVSWIAARGLVLVALLGIAALLVLDRAKRREAVPGLWTAGVLVALAIWSQVAGITVVPLALVAATWRQRPGRAVHAALAILVPCALALIVRRVATGTWSLGYLGGISAGTVAIPDMLRRLPPMALHELAPWNASAPPVLWSVLAGSGIPKWAALLPWLALLALAIASRPRPWIARAGVTLVASGVLALPALFLWGLSPALPDDARFDRALYPLTAGVAVLLAILVDAASVSTPRATVTPRRERQAPAWPWSPANLAHVALAVALLLLAIIAIDAMVSTCRIEARAAELIRSRRAAVAGLAPPASEGSLVAKPVCLAIDPEVTFAGVPLIGPRHFPRAMRRPFAAPGVEAHAFGDLDRLLDDDVLCSRHDPLVLLRWTDDRFVPLGSSLPAIPFDAPEIVPSASPLPGVQAFAPASSGLPVPPRAIPAIALVFTASDTARTLQLGLQNERAAPVFEIPVPPQTSEIAAGFSDLPDWLFAQDAKAVFVRGVEAVRVRVLPGLPEIEARSMLADGSPGTGEWPLDEPPAFAVGRATLPADARFTFVVSVGDATYRMSYRASLRELEAGKLSGFPGVACWRPKPAQFERADHPDLRWDRVPAYFHETLSRAGLKTLPFSWRVTLLHPGTEVPLARSRWNTLTLVAPR